MPAIEPIPLDELDPELAPVVAHGQAAGYLSSTTSVQIWAHLPSAAAAWVRTIGEFHEHGVLDERTRELVRLHISSFTQCLSCQVARKSDTVTEEDVACLDPADPRFTPREQAALRFAGKFASDYFSIDDADFLDLAEHFTTEEVVDLGMFSALMLAGGRLNYVFRGYTTDDRPTLLTRSVRA